MNCPKVRISGALRLGRALAVDGPAPAEARAVVVVMYQLHAMLTGVIPLDLGGMDYLTEVIRGVDLTTANPMLVLVEPGLALISDDTDAGLAAVARLLDHPDPWVRAMLLSMRGAIRENSGDADGMMRDAAAAVAAFRQVGERWGLSTSLAGLADALGKRGDFAGASAALDESIRLVHELNPGDDAGHQRIWLASIRAHTDPAQARADLTAYIGQQHDSSGRDVAFAQLVLSDLARFEGDHAEAGRLLADGLAGLEEAPMVAPQFRAMGLACAAHLAVARGRFDEAAPMITEAIGYAMKAADMPVVARVALATVDLDATTGDPALAAEVLGAADALRGTRDLASLDAERLSRLLREALGETGFAAAYAKGHGRDRQGALALIDPGHTRRR